jgi:hypothetical protein
LHRDVTANWFGGDELTVALRFAANSGMCAWAKLTAEMDDDQR